MSLDPTQVTLLILSVLVLLLIALVFVWIPTRTKRRSIRREAVECLALLATFIVAGAIVTWQRGDSKSIRDVGGVGGVRASMYDIREVIGEPTLSADAALTLE